MKNNTTKKEILRARTNKFLALSLIFAFIVSLVYTSPSVSAVSAPLVNRIQNTNMNTGGQALNMHVVLSPAPAPVKAVSVAALFESCQMTVIKNNNLVQGGEGVNLNQPAKCFSLQLAPKNVSSQNLAVRNLPPQPKIIVAFKQTFLAAPDFLPAPFGRGAVPALPAMPVVVLAAVLVLRKRIYNSLCRLINNRPFFAGPHNMQILRC